MGYLKSRKSNKKNNALFLIRIKNISQLELAVLFNFFLQSLYLRNQRGCLVTLLLLFS